MAAALPQRSYNSSTARLRSRLCSSGRLTRRERQLPAVDDHDLSGRLARGAALRLHSLDDVHTLEDAPEDNVLAIEPETGSVAGREGWRAQGRVRGRAHAAVRSQTSRRTMAWLLR